MSTPRAALFSALPWESRKLASSALLFLALAALAVPASALDRSAFSFPNYDLQATLDPHQHALSVEGTVEVRNVFKISKVGTVAGCMVIEGLIRRNASGRLYREGKEVWAGKIEGLKRFKEGAREVKEGLECGISLEGQNDIKEGDIIEAFDVEEVKQTL